MSLIKDMRDYILEKEFKIIYLNNKLDVVNYTNISHFDTNKIIINHSNGSITISGNNLYISKLLIDELLVEGSIEKIEFRWNYEFSRQI